MATIFLKLQHDHDNEGKYFAIDESKIETLNVSDSYDQFGQRIGPDDAGDYLELTSIEAAVLANDCHNDIEGNDDDDRENPYTAGMNIVAYENAELFDAVCDNPRLGVVTHRTTFEGFNYWNGSNFRTLSLSSIDDSHSHEIETDEAIIARLNESLENMEEVSEGRGLTTYRYKDVEVIESHYAGAWEEYTITLDNDFEDED